MHDIQQWFNNKEYSNYLPSENNGYNNAGVWFKFFNTKYNSAAIRITNMEKGGIFKTFAIQWIQQWILDCIYFGTPLVPCSPFLYPFFWIHLCSLFLALVLCIQILLHRDTKELIHHWNYDHCIFISGLKIYWHKWSMILHIWI